jgi:hypothetical protein
MTKLWWNSLTLEQQQEYNKLRSQRHKEKIDAMSPEELQEYRIKQRDGWKKFGENLTPEQKKQLRETIKANARAKWSNLPSEIKNKEKEAMKIRGQQVVAKQKHDIISHYSKKTMKCARCGFSDMRALSIDHINGGGRKHTEEIKKQGTIFYRWLIKNGFPEGFQVLCMNCNYIKKSENKEDTGHKVK